MIRMFGTGRQAEDVQHGSGTVEQGEGMECGWNASGDMFDIIAFQHRILMYYCYHCCSRCRSGGILEERFAHVECPGVQNRPERVIRYFSVHFSCGKRAQRMESDRYPGLELAR